VNGSKRVKGAAPRAAQHTSGSARSAFPYSLFGGFLLIGWLALTVLDQFAGHHYWRASGYALVIAVLALSLIVGGARCYVRTVTQPAGGTVHASVMKFVLFAGLVLAAAQWALPGSGGLRALSAQSRVPATVCCRDSFDHDFFEVKMNRAIVKVDFSAGGSTPDFADQYCKDPKWPADRHKCLDFTYVVFSKLHLAYGKPTTVLLNRFRQAELKGEELTNDTLRGVFVVDAALCAFAVYAVWALADLRRIVGRPKRRAVR
jgi:hypothetical protein